MKTDRIWMILWGILIVIGIVLTVYYFWPIFLVIALLIFAAVMRTRHTIHQANKQAQDMLEQETERNASDALFREQVKKKQTADIIDAEVVEHPADEEEKRS